MNNSASVENTRRVVLLFIVVSGFISYGI
jgi:hypothetical protein